VAVSAAISGLAPGTKYYYEVEATNAGGTTDGLILSFTTTPPLTAPAAATQAATAITITTATLNASVDPEGSATTVSFIYGTDPNLASGTWTTPGEPGGNGTDSMTMSAAIDSLSPGTTYYYRVVAANSAGTTDGLILHFTAGNTTPPAATTQAATDVKFVSATLNAIINPAGSATTVSFIYDTNSDLSSGTTISAGVFDSDGTVSMPVTNLTPGTTYYYEVVATSAGGTTDGSIVSFETIPGNRGLYTQVTGVQWQTERIGKKTIMVLDVTFSGALDESTASDAGAYLLQVAQGNKRHSRGSLASYLFKSASYNATTNTVQLTGPNLKVPNKTMQLTINGSLIVDAQGNELDGTNSAEPGSNFVTTLSRGGAVSMARTMVKARAGQVIAAAVDALMADGSLARTIRHQHVHRRPAH
jgi:hypothetical protein